MNIKQLECFAAAVEAGNFTRASEQLHMAQSAFSRQISNLEASLGVQLFIRGGRGVELSPEGVVAYDRASRILSDLREFSRDMRSADPPAIRRISVAAHGGTGPLLLPQVADAANRPRPNLQFRLAEDSSEQIERDVSSGNVDIGLVIRRRGFPIERNNLETIHLLEDEIFALVPEESELAPADTWTAQTTFERAMVMAPSGSLERAAFENRARHYGQTLKIAGEAAQFSLRLELAKRTGALCMMPGLGLADLPQLSKWQICRLERDDLYSGLEWFVIYRRGEGDKAIQHVVSVIQHESMLLLRRSKKVSLRAN